MSVAFFTRTYIIRKSHGGSVRWSVDTADVRSARKSRCPILQLLSESEYQIERQEV